MNLKKIAIVLLWSGIFLSSCSSGNTADSKGEKTIAVGYMTDVNGLGDQGFNDTINFGIKEAQKENSNLKVTTVTPTSSGEMESTMRTLARKNELIICGSSTLEDATKTVSKEFPNVKFIQIDGSVDGQENLESLSFREEEAAYLVGAFSALMSNKDKIGFVGGVNNPVIDKFAAGYIAGAESQGKAKDDILVAYTGAFNDPALGKQTATALYSSGAKYIFTCAGACNLGVFESAEVNDFIPLGAATGQFDKSDKIVASHVKSVDVLIENLLNDYINNNTFNSGLIKNGLKESGVNIKYSPKNEDSIPKEVKDKIEDLKQQIMDGKITVPNSTK